MVQLVWEFIARKTKSQNSSATMRAMDTGRNCLSAALDFDGTALLRDMERRGRYLTVDSWESAGAHHAMRAEFSREYEQLDRDCEDFTERESHLGDFEVK